MTTAETRSTCMRYNASWKPCSEIATVEIAHKTKCGRYWNPCTEISTACSFYNGNAFCKCPDGYLSKNEECIDYNECDTTSCDEGFECINTPGSYYCSGCNDDPLKLGLPISRGNTAEIQHQSIGNDIILSCNQMKILNFEKPESKRVNDTHLGKWIIQSNKTY